MSVPTYLVPIKKKDGTIAKEKAHLHLNDYRLGAEGVFPTIPIDSGVVKAEIECPGRWNGLLKGREGEHRFETDISFDLTGKKPKETRKIKCPNDGQKIKFKAYLEQKPKEPHVLHFNASVPAGAGLSNKKVKLVVSPPYQTSPTE